MAHHLDRMSLDDLWVLYEEVGKYLVGMIAAKKKVLDAGLERLGGERSIANMSRPRPYPSVRQKYRNPDNPVETWSGRGKQPHWVGKQFAVGKTLQNLTIQP